MEIFLTLHLYRPRFIGQITPTKLKTPLARQGVVLPEPEARSPAAVKARLSKTTRVRVFSIWAFPQGSMWWERPRKERGKVSGGLSGLAPSRGALAAKNPGSLPPPAPLLCGAPPRPAGGGHVRRSLASVGVKGRWKSVLSRLQCGISEKRSTTTARASPSERVALW